MKIARIDVSRLDIPIDKPQRHPGRTDSFISFPATRGGGKARRASAELQARWREMESEVGQADVGTTTRMRERPAPTGTAKSTSVPFRPGCLISRAGIRRSGASSRADVLQEQFERYHGSVFAREMHEDAGRVGQMVC